MTSIGYATLNIIPSAKGFGSALNGEVAPVLGTQGKRGGAALGGGILGAARGALAPLAGVMAGVFATTAIVGWGKAQIASLGRIEQINAQTSAVIKSTGGAAGVTTAQIEGLAGSLENLTGTEAETIQQGANMLLTFKNIKNGVGEGNDIFNQATAALVDMSRAMGSDPQTAAIQLGKALNDPIAGISALSRVGIQFTDDQKALIQSLVETGQTAEAQKIILAELNSQFGGSGAAYAATYAGKVALLGHAWGTFGETIFSSVMPALGAAAGGLTGLLNNVLTPGVVGIQNGIAGIAAAFRGDVMPSDLGAWTAPLATIGTTLRGIVDSIASSFAPVVPMVRDAFAQLGPVLAQAVPMLSPLGLVFQALRPVLPQIAELLGALAVSIATGLGTVLPPVTAILGSIVDLLSGVLTAAMPGIVSLFGALTSVLDAVWPAVGAVLDAIMPLIETLLADLAPILTDLVTTALPILADLFGLIAEAIGPLVSMLLDVLMPVLNALMPVVETVFGVIADVIGSQMEIVRGLIEVITGLISGDWDQVWNGLVGILSGVWDLISGLVSGALALIRSIIGAALAILTDRWTRVWNAVSSFVGTAWSNITSAISAGIESAVGFIGSLPGRALAALAGIGTFLLDAGRNLMRGFLDGIAAVARNLTETILGPIRGAVEAVRSFLGIHSPSRLFMEIGRHTTEGLALGIERAAPLIERASALLVPSPPTGSRPPLLGSLAAIEAAIGTPGGIEFNYTQNGGDGLTSEQEVARAARRLKQSLRR